jgi:hypothetical protein
LISVVKYSNIGFGSNACSEYHIILYKYMLVSTIPISGMCVCVYVWQEYFSFIQQKKKWTPKKDKRKLRKTLINSLQLIFKLLPVLDLFYIIILFVLSVFWFLILFFFNKTLNCFTDVTLLYSIRLVCSSVLIFF